MASFSDHLGRSWTVVVDRDAQERIRHYGHDPAGLADGTLIRQFLSDRLRFVIFVYKLVEPQCVVRGMDATDFWRLSSRCFYPMQKALLDALKYFDPAAAELAELEIGKWPPVTMPVLPAKPDTTK